MNKDLKVEYISASVLNVAEYNPRKHTNDQKEQLKESIKRFGLVDPIICNKAPDRMNIVIGGHFRLKVAKELGITEVPVLYLDIPDIEKEKELNIRLNKNVGEWDLELLKNFDFDSLLEFGFDESELKFWDEDLDVKEEEFDEHKELKSITDTKVKLGDIILLGKHRLICGDSTDPVVLKKLFSDEKASMIYSDPIYNIKIDYNGGVGGKQNYGGNVNDSEPMTSTRNSSARASPLPCRFPIQTSTFSIGATSHTSGCSRPCTRNLESATSGYVSGSRTATTPLPISHSTNATSHAYTVPSEARSFTNRIRD